jgi:hypothetical protein
MNANKKNPREGKRVRNVHINQEFSRYSPKKVVLDGVGDRAFTIGLTGLFQRSRKNPYTPARHTPYGTDRCHRRSFPPQGLHGAAIISGFFADIPAGFP